MKEKGSVKCQKTNVNAAMPFDICLLTFDIYSIP